MTKFLNDLKCIKHTLVNSDGETTVTYITYNQYRTSFVDERWTGERRTGKIYTMFGYDHTKTTVRFGNLKSTHTFDFPRSREQAEALDAEQDNTKF